MFAFLMAQVVSPPGVDVSFEMVLDLVRAGNFRAVAVAIIVLVVRYGAPLLAQKVPFFDTSKGKAVFVIVLAVAGGVLQSLLPGSVPGFGVVWESVLNALVAAGSFSLLKPFFEKPAAPVPAVVPVPSPPPGG